MKVPKMYKSSDRYNAGTDVIYDDDSKLQYAPFIYAGVTAKDNGGDGGDDEEGEDTMVITLDLAAGGIDKSFKDLTDAVNSGKIVALRVILADTENEYNGSLYYLVALDRALESDSTATFATVYYDDNASDYATGTMVLEASNITDNMVLRS